MIGAGKLSAPIIFFVRLLALTVSLWYIKKRGYPIRSEKGMTNNDIASTFMDV